MMCMLVCWWRCAAGGGGGDPLRSSTRRQLSAAAAVSTPLLLPHLAPCCFCFLVGVCCDHVHYVADRWACAHVHRRGTSASGDGAQLWRRRCVYVRCPVTQWWSCGPCRRWTAVALGVATLLCLPLFCAPTGCAILLDCLMFSMTMYCVTCCSFSCSS